MGRVSARAGFRWIAVAVGLVAAAPVYAQGTGVLFITSNPPGVTVLVDGERAGQTPLTLSSVKAGLHTVATRTADYVDEEATVMVTAGEVASVAFALTKATGGVVLESDLVGLRVYLDGEYIGDVTEGEQISAGDLMVGPHTLRLEGPFFSTVQSFAVGKGETTRVPVKGQSLVGSLSVSSTIPATGLSIGGIQVAQGPPPYVVRNMAPGSYMVTVQTEPVPYLTRATVSAGRTVEIDLDATEDVGKVLVTAPLEQGGVEVNIDGILMAEEIPTVIEGVVKGPHTVEVIGRRAGTGAGEVFEPPVMGRASVWVTGGGIATVTLSADALTDGSPPCPDGMVRISPGPVEGEFWFQHWDDEHSPAVGEGEPIAAVPGDPVTLTAPGVSLTLKSVGAAPVSNEQKRDLTTGKVLNEVKRFTAVADVPFCIDIYEYPNRRGVKPAQMSYLDAAAACAKEGKRLCSSVEWVRACTGPEGTDYPYGSTYQPARCNTIDNPRSRGLAPAGSFADCVNGYGLYDMSGNAAEWTMAETMMTWTPVEGEGHLTMTDRRLLYTGVARHYDSLYEHSDSPKIDLRGGSWLSKGWDASCRAMPSLIGSYIAPAPSEQGAGAMAVGSGPMMGSSGPMMGSGGMMGSPGPMMGSGGMMGSSGPMMGSGGMMGGSGPMMGSGGMMGGSGGMMGGGSAGPSQPLPGTTVTRGAGADSRYLGSARLRGFRCCTFAHGLGNAARVETAGTGGTVGGMGMMMGGGAGSLLGMGGGTR